MDCQVPNVQPLLHTIYITFATSQQIPRSAAQTAAGHSHRSCERFHSKAGKYTHLPRIAKKLRNASVCRKDLTSGLHILYKVAIASSLGAAGVFSSLLKTPRRPQVGFFGLRWDPQISAGEFLSGSQSLGCFIGGE